MANGHLDFCLLVQEVFEGVPVRSTVLLHIWLRKIRPAVAVISLHQISFVSHPNDFRHFWTVMRRFGKGL
jgi:hypothetical protein